MKILLTLLLMMSGWLAAGSQAGEQSWVLLDGDQAAILIHQCSRESPVAIQSVWTPSAEILEDMESRLTAISRLEASICCGIGASVDDVNAYYRQYAGLVVEDRKLIYINAFAHNAGIKDWHTQPVLHCGGGRSFWGVLYDPASKLFFDLAFNGDDEGGGRE